MDKIKLNDSIMKKILKNIRIGTRVFTLGLVLTSVISLGIFTQSCNKDEEQPLDDVIINSAELGEYITAGADLQKSLDIFTIELNRVDFSKLEVSYDNEGRKVMRLPAGSVSTRIEEKVQTFNNKKDAVQKKFPRFASHKEDVVKEYLQQCIQSSIYVKGEFLKLGINTSRPRLKSGSSESYSHDCDLYEFLYPWMNNSSYVEVIIIQYTDGSFSVFIDNRNTTNQSWTPSLTYNNSTGNYYYPGGGNSNPIAWMAHTHQNSATPGPNDYASKNHYPGLDHYIYYNYAFNYF